MLICLFVGGLEEDDVANQSLQLTIFNKSYKGDRFWGDLDRKYHN